MKKILFLALLLVSVSLSACTWFNNEKAENEKIDADDTKTPVITEPAIINDETPAVTENTKDDSLSYFSMDSAEGWEILENTKNKVVFSVPDSKHKITLIMNIEERSAEMLGTPIKELGDTKVYNFAVGGPYAGYSLLVGDQKYNITFDIESDQVMPADQDGPWVPEHDFQDEALIDLLVSALPLSDVEQAMP